MYEHCKIQETTYKPVSGSETTGSLISLLTEQQHKCLKNVLNFFLLPSKQQKHRQLLVKGLSCTAISSKLLWSKLAKCCWVNHKITPKLDRKQFDRQSSRTATSIGCKLLHSQYQQLKVAAANHLMLLQTLGIIIGTGSCKLDSPSSSNAYTSHWL